MVIVFFLFLVISYLLFNAIPGNAFSSLLLNPLLPPEAYQKTIEAFALEQPLFEKTSKTYFSFTVKGKVSEIIFETDSKID